MNTLRVNYESMKEGVTAAYVCVPSNRFPSADAYSELMHPFFSCDAGQTPWSERKALMRVLWTVVISPLGQVRFLEGYVGDILTRFVWRLDCSHPLRGYLPCAGVGWLLLRVNQ